jgi:hypothetical protein
VAGEAGGPLHDRARFLGSHENGWRILRMGSPPPLPATTVSPRTRGGGALEKTIVASERENSLRRR